MPSADTVVTKMSDAISPGNIDSTLQWRHDGRDGVSNHQPHDCLFIRLFRRRSNENIKAPRHWPLWGEFTGHRWIPRTNSQLRGKCFHLMTSSRSADSHTGHEFGQLFSKRGLGRNNLEVTYWWVGAKRRNSSALAMELRLSCTNSSMELCLSCTKPSICFVWKIWMTRLFPQISAVNDLENGLVNPVPFFHNCIRDITQNIVTQKLSSPMALYIHKYSSQPPHCPFQWAANGHKRLFWIIGHDSQDAPPFSSSKGSFLTNHAVVRLNYCSTPYWIQT